MGARHSHIKIPPFPSTAQQAFTVEHLQKKATGAARAKASLKRQPVPQPLLSKEPKLSSTVRKPKLNGARQSSRVTKRSNVSNAPAAAVTATAAAPSSQ
eukprot:9574-Heterococcus_DN1.PRE.1